VTVNGHNYGLFAPAKSKWQKNGSSLECDLAGKDYFSVAILPSKGDDTLEKFRKHAYAFVTDTQVSWKYDEPSAKLSATYEFKTKQMDDQKGLSSDSDRRALPSPVEARDHGALLEETYVSPRGLLKVAEVAKFTTDFTFNGILPALPPIPGADLGSVRATSKKSPTPTTCFPKATARARRATRTGSANRSGATPA